MNRQEGHEPYLDVVTNMCLEEIEELNSDLNKCGCHEMTEQKIKKTSRTKPLIGSSKDEETN